VLVLSSELLLSLSLESLVPLASSEESSLEESTFEESDSDEESL
jgi:hypothetical protein